MLIQYLNNHSTKITNYEDVLYTLGGSNIDDSKPKVYQHSNTTIVDNIKFQSEAKYVKTTNLAAATA